MGRLARSSWFRTSKTKLAQFPPSAPVKKLNQQHPDYAFYAETWDQIGTLYQGGVKIREAVMRGGQFLTKNPKELPEVFAVRQLRFSYTNLLGNVVGWYMSALFKQPPQLVKKQAGVEGEAALVIPQEVSDFCEEFEKNCDRGGVTFNDFMSQVAEACVLWRCAYVLIDIPAPASTGGQQVSLHEQKSQGLFNPFLVLYSPGSVIDWSMDAYGNLEWLVVYLRSQDQDFLGEAKVMDSWYYFDREQVALYQRDVKDGPSVGAGGGEEIARLVEGYPRAHAMADQKRVPVHRVCLKEGLWLANRVFLPLVNHLNQDNALDFVLMQSNIPQLVIEDGVSGKYEEDVTISAVGYHHIPNGGSISFLEPGGVAFEAGQARIDNLEERIYKACYLMDQARTNRSTPTAQSGVSKQQDKTPSRDALSGIGDVLRPAMQNIYADVLKIANFTQITPDVRGFDFSDKATAEDLQLLEQGAVIPVNSELFEREIGKKAVRLMLPDANPETLDQIDSQIDTNPTPSALAAQQQEAQQQAMVGKFEASVKSSAQGAASSE